MGIRRALNHMLKPLGLALERRVAPAGVYDQDGLRSVHNHDFMDDAAFQAAYRRGVAAGGKDPRWHWRVHVGLWAAADAVHLAGDFVECGVNHGAFASAVMHFLDWDRQDKTFFLLDTWQGMDARFVSETEIAAGALAWNERALGSGRYATDLEAVRANFASWKNVRFVPGAVPETLPEVGAERVAFLHLDMNCAPPEVAAAEYFWPRLVPGAFMLLDDYAYRGFGVQKAAMDDFARSHGVSVLSLPTGQGLVKKPA